MKINGLEKKKEKKEKKIREKRKEKKRQLVVYDWSHGI